MGQLIRVALPSDDGVIGDLARDGDATADPPYLALLRGQGARVLVAESDGRVVAFGAVIDVVGVTMLTDLFVAPEVRGTGIGTRLLPELFAGCTHRMTFSSKHPAAIAAYRRAGMQPGWRLLYLQGPATGGGVLPATGEWRHARAGLVKHLAGQGAVVFADVVVAATAAGMRVTRLQSERPIEVLAELLAGLPRETVVSMCVPEHSPVASWAQAHDFAVVDFDTFCATPQVELPGDLHCLDPGLA